MRTGLPLYPREFQNGDERIGFINGLRRQKHAGGKKKQKNRPPRYIVPPPLVEQIAGGWIGGQNHWAWHSNQSEIHARTFRPKDDLYPSRLKKYQKPLDEGRRFRIDANLHIFQM
jgi:hypothetical protein